MESSEKGELTLGDLTKLIKGFVDMVILASGYQSSGLHAHWDAANLKKAFKWALFFEDVLNHLHSLSNCKDFLKELEASLSELRSNPVFPQGLACLSSATLAKARTFLMEHLIHALPLREEHLKALMSASIEMDLDDLNGMEYDCLNMYLDNLMLLSASFTFDTKRRVKKNDSITLSPHCVETMETDDFNSDHSKLTAQELLRRESSVSRLLFAETCLDILSKIVGSNEFKETNSGLGREDPCHATTTMSEVELVGFSLWKQWRSRSLSYFLDKRTLRLISGASLIFSAPKTQWIQVFKQLNSSSSISDDNMHETLEIMLLGCIRSQWDCIVQHFTCLSSDWIPSTKQYLELRNLLQGKSSSPLSATETMNSEVGDIFMHLTELLGPKTNHLWKLPPTILAVAIPSWSPLFRLYLGEIESQLKGECRTIRLCNCMEDGKEHIDCALAERVWCLYAFHVCKVKVG